jgi:hypothetical protein
MANLYFSQDIGMPFLKPFAFTKHMPSLSDTSKLNLICNKTMTINSPPIQRCVEALEGLSLMLNTLIAAEDRRCSTSRAAENTKKQLKVLQEKLRVEPQILIESFSKQFHYLNKSNAFEKQ